VWKSGGQKDDVAGCCLELLSITAERGPARDDVEQFVLVTMPMQRRRETGRIQELDTQRVAFATAVLDHPERVEPSGPRLSPLAANDLGYRVTSAS